VALVVDREVRIEGDPHHTSKLALKHGAMEFYIARTLRRLGYEVSIVACDTGQQFIADLTALRPDVAFNVAEHVHGRRSADLLVPALLDLLRIPYTGATPTALLLCRDKAVSKSLAAKVGVRVPAFALAPIGMESPVEVPPFPVVVKPVSRDSSEGITLGSLVRTRAALQERLRFVHRRFGDAAIVEEFVDGVDTYVFAVEGATLQIRPPHQLLIDAGGSAARSMATFQVKHNDAYRKRWGIRSRAARLKPATLEALHESVRRLWPVLQLRDYARLDFRLTPANELVFIEANANPGFSPASRSDNWSAGDYEAAVRQVIENALARGQHK
jgi:D-alanine-D-alanine ligase